jgi:hypothetical protein
MALPKIDTPVYELTLPLSKKNIRFRPFLVKEQKNLMMALEANDSDTIEKNIKQVLINCTINDDVDFDDLPIVDIEYYFLNLRARSIGEIVELKYRCNNEVDGMECSNIMETSIDVLDIKVEGISEDDSLIQITDQIVMKLKYPRFGSLNQFSKVDDATELAINMIADSVEYIFDGEQYYYANEVSKNEIVEFIEGLNQTQFSKIEVFFDNIPKLNKMVNIKCSKCGFDHVIYVEGLEDFFV